MRQRQGLLPPARRGRPRAPRARSRPGPAGRSTSSTRRNEKMAAKVPQMVGTVDVLLGNLEDAVKADNKEAARAGLVRIAKETDFGPTQLWTRINALDSPWALDDLTTLVTEIGDKLDVIMVPKVQGAEDIHYVDRLLAQLEAKAGLDRPILVHAILETARGVANVEEICGASPRMQGLSLGPADLAADRRMKTTRVGGGHPGYLVRQDPKLDQPTASRRPTARPTSRTCGTTRSRAWSTPARCTASTPTTARSATSPTWSRARTSSATPSCSAASAPGACTPSRSRSPTGSSAPVVEDIRHARRVVAAMGDGTGAVMLDGKMEDDASLKQCLVMVELAEQLAAIDPALKEQYDAIEVARDERLPPPPLRALHAELQRQGAGEGEDPAGRRHHLRPRGRRRPRRQAGGPRGRRRRRRVGAYGAPRADHPRQRHRHRVARRRPRRGGCRRARRGASYPRSSSAEEVRGSSRRSRRPAPPSTPSSGRWSRPPRRCFNAREIAAASERLIGAGDGHQRPGQGAVRRARARPRARPRRRWHSRCWPPAPPASRSSTASTTT